MELPLEGSDAIRVEGSGLAEEFDELLGPQNRDVPNRETAADQWPIGLDEAQDAADGDVWMVSQCRPHEL